MQSSSDRAAAAWLPPIVLLGALAFAAAAPAQSHLPKVEFAPELRALIAIRARMARTIHAIPSYTCAQTIRRTQLNEKARQRLEKMISRFGEDEARVRIARDFSDTLSLEVAIIDGAEIYSWPGAEFSPVPLAEMVGFGVVASGSFSSFAKSLFVNSQGRILYVGEEELGGSATLRYDYRVPLLRSGYRVSTPQGEAAVGYEGSFWARRDDHRLLRLTVRAIEIPPELGTLRSVTTEIDYGEVEIDGERFSLPTSTVHEMTDWDGALARNETTFHNCRKFGASSELSFEAADGAPEPEARPAKVLNVPVGSELHLELLSEISEKSVVGDQIEARLRRALVVGGRVIADKGALLLGRLRRIHRVGRAEDPYYAISLEFTELRSGEAVAAIHSELVRLQPLRDVSTRLDVIPDTRTSRRGTAYDILGVVEKTVIVEDGDHDLAGLDTFYVHGASFRLSKGFQMTWRVVEPRP